MKININLCILFIITIFIIYFIYKFFLKKKEFLSEKIKEGDTAVVDIDDNNKVQVLLGERMELALV
jgi:hypothetical protein